MPRRLVEIGGFLIVKNVDRRVHRRLLQPQDADRLRQKIKELFPGVDVPKPS
jgi:hypothetical protein